MSYMHDWQGTYMQQRCSKCGETAFAACDYCDSTKMVDHLEKTIARRDCPCPPRTVMDVGSKQLQFDLRQL